MLSKVAGVWVVESPFQEDPVRENPTPAQFDEVDRQPILFNDLVSRLTEIVVQSSRLSLAEKKRMTEFIFTAGTTLSSRARLGPGDQELFEQSLLQSARRLGYRG
jgi:hypothetical protein